MLFQIATLAMAAGVVAVPQGVTSAIAPAQSPPPGCSPNYNGLFEIGPVNVSTSERDLDKVGRSFLWSIYSTKITYRGIQR